MLLLRECEKEKTRTPGICMTKSLFLQFLPSVMGRYSETLKGLTKAPLPKGSSAWKHTRFDRSASKAISQSKNPVSWNIKCLHSNFFRQTLDQSIEQKALLVYHNERFTGFVGACVGESSHALRQLQKWPTRMRRRNLVATRKHGAKTFDLELLMNLEQYS